MNTSSFSDNSFLREHLPSARATDDFEASVLARAALNRLPEAGIPESFESIVIRQAQQMKLIRTLLYSAVGLGILGAIAYFMFVRVAPVRTPAYYELPAPPLLLLPSEATPPVVETHINPVIMQRVEAQIKLSAQRPTIRKGVTGR